MEAEPLINVDDFKKIELSVQLTNTTTSTRLKDGKMTYTEGNRSIDSGDNQKKDMSVRIEEFLDDGLILEIPSKLCAEGHSLEIVITPKNVKGYEHFVFEASGPISEKEKISKTREKITLNFQEYKKADFDHLKKVFSVRQGEILDFFKAVKGY